MFAARTEPPQHIGLFVVPQFAMMGFTSAIEPLRSANRLSGRELYAWHIVARDGQPVMASNGISVLPERSIGEPANFSSLIVCAGIDAHLYEDRPVFAWLRRLDRQGIAIGAISLGSYVLAKAGLLEGYRCTLHWENLESFLEEYPQLEVTSELFEIDRNRFTCSGGIAALDMMLHMISQQHGHALAAAVCDQFLHERMRDRHDRQRMALPARLGVRHPKLIAVIKRMEESLEEPISRARLADGVSLSCRQLERLFRRYLGRTPTRYYLELRLQRARTLLQQTDMPVMDVALASGFVSASHFSKCYRELFKKTPRAERMLTA